MCNAPWLKGIEISELKSNPGLSSFLWFFSLSYVRYGEEPGIIHYCGTELGQKEEALKVLWRCCYKIGCFGWLAPCIWLERQHWDRSVMLIWRIVTLYLQSISLPVCGSCLNLIIVCYPRWQFADCISDSQMTPEGYSVMKSNPGLN